MRSQGTPNLMIPDHWLTTAALPRLGSGKADFAGAKRLAKEQLDMASH